ncbi:phospholipase D/nuclease [Microthyrium microscopicum]|uniref:Phospholipase n=1 Tax=Microthyrium microscopicum TaxID=703497 RepID=A0A6A6UDS9_9PEZI|nr:phospholipase D/nuclease [Microthyrium microscopicum]
MSRRRGDDDDLAYGDYHGPDHGDVEERGFLGDVFHRIDGLRPQQQSDQSEPASTSKTSNTSTMSGLFGKLHGAVHSLGSELKTRISGMGNQHSHTHLSGECEPGYHDHHAHNRFIGFAPERATGNDVKWYVDGCGYMWAVSMALEQAQQYVYIMDWWLSPELYLRRPPAAHEQYRLDKMLHAAAERGVKVNIIVYKEVTQALTRKYLNPWLPNYLHQLLPHHTDIYTRAVTKLGLQTIFESLEYIEKHDPLISPPITVSSSHTKHALEELHPNIAVIRHPDHLPDQKTIAANLADQFKNFKLTAANASRLPGEALESIYGTNAETVLYWAHHEKLCLIDGKIAFMGGLDLCYGRWDTNQHSIADAHPGDINKTVFPGQDYNNSRVMDFQDVQNWQNNKLDRTENSRMGWSDIALSIVGPVVQDLGEHFVQRWNFIYDEKYHSRPDPRYARLEHTSTLGGYQQATEQDGEESRGISDTVESGIEHVETGVFGMKDKLKQHLHHHQHNMDPQLTSELGSGSGISCQIVRSACKWSHGSRLEHSIANAYIDVIKNSEHFVYIENQFFITATSDQQHPIRNKIGAAIVERIIRAAQNGQNYRMIVLMPAVPAFAGDLRNDDALATRAIMEFQYASISRGGHSIYEKIAQAGYNPLDYIRFYNLRNYDRINVSSAMKSAEQQSGIPYEEARKEHDAMYSGGFQQQGGYGEQPQHQPGAFDTYQQGTQQVGDQGNLATGRWDSVADCYMLNGPDIRSVPWQEGNVAEIDAFVTEELYIHSKLLIADDRIVICGSANLNDRSQLGSHDSEIAVVIQDKTPHQSTLGGNPYSVSKFATSLRRTIFRKHLGLLSPQDYSTEHQNYTPVNHSPNEYDWDSAEDAVVTDPLSDAFWARWNETAATNTEVFGKVFHVVPHDNVKSWKEYDTWYEDLFRAADPKDAKKKAGPYKVGHVVRDEFPGGVAQVKDELARVKGTLVEMPLMFLKEEDIAQEGISLNAFTAEVYT